MAYYVGLPIVYTALATTAGRPSDTFTYAWAFDDATTMSGDTGNKTWDTLGAHSATVTATDNLTGASDTDTKTITVVAVPVKFAEPFTVMVGSSTLGRLMGNGVYPRTSVDYALSWQTQAYPSSNVMAMSGDGVRSLSWHNATQYAYITRNSGATWVDTGLTPGTWSTLAIARGGTYMLAGGNGSDYLYVTVDDSVTWTPATAFGVDGWFCATVSSTGQYMFVRGGSKGISRSVNHGTTWAVSSTPLATKNIRSIACNDAGDLVVACADDQYGTGTDYIYLSTDYGANFVAKTAAGKRSWTSVCASSSGTHMGAVAFGGSGYIYLSSDSGATWAANTAAGLKNWGNILISSDGGTIIASWWDGYGSNCVTSFDFGVTWI